MGEALTFLFAVLIIAVIVVVIALPISLIKKARANRAEELRLLRKIAGEPSGSGGAARGAETAGSEQREA